MTIEDTSGYLDNLWDWACLRGCFGESDIQPTDIDGWVERNDRFLVIETKSPYAPVKMGQLRSIEALQRNGVFTVIVVWGKPGAPEQAQIYGEKGTSKKFACDLPLFRQLVAGWYQQASAGKDVIALSHIVKARHKRV